jgi:hypothetical protein
VVTQKVQTLNACLLWAGGVLEVVEGIIGQCGSKSDAKWQGERDKSDHNPKVATVTKSDDGDDKVATNSLQVKRFPFQVKFFFSKVTTVTTKFRR